MNTHPQNLNKNTLIQRVSDTMLAMAFSSEDERNRIGTELMLFTAEGLLRAHNRSINRGICHVESVVDYALLRWLSLYGLENQRSVHALSSSSPILMALKSIHVSRQLKSPEARACAASLQRKPRIGIPAINSCQSDIVLTSAIPVAAMGISLNLDDQWTYEQTVDLAALTHSDPAVKLRAGFSALFLRHLYLRTSGEVNIALERATNAVAALGADMRTLDVERVIIAFQPQMSGLQARVLKEPTSFSDTKHVMANLIADVANDLCLFPTWPGEFDPPAHATCRSRLYPPC
jgi:hypothetical protein